MSTSVGRLRVKGGVLLGALTSVALAAGVPGAGTPTAKATCASVFGIGNTADCTSNLSSIAIAIGSGAQAHAERGLFGAAFSIGTAAQARINEFYLSANVFDVTVAAGDYASAGAAGVLGVAAQLGRNGRASVGGSFAMGNIAVGVSPGTPVLNGTKVLASGLGTIAVNLFGTGNGGTNVGAFGLGCVAVNLFSTGNAPSGHSVVADGRGAFAANIGGSDNQVSATAVSPGGALNTAFNIFGSRDEVLAGPGPLALAGSILQNDKKIEKIGPGFNINGLKVPNTAAAVRAGKRTASAASSVGGSKRTAAPAASVGHRVRPSTEG